jgi:hypothetical protein
MVSSVVALLLAGTSGPASARAALDLCRAVPRAALEDRIGTPLATPHDLSTEPTAAGCHFPARAVGGTDVGLYASTDVPAGIRRSYGGSFFATVDTFGRAYGSPVPVTGIAGVTAYLAFTPGPLAQGALLELRGAKQAALVVLVGRDVTTRNTLSRARGIARAVLATLRHG